LIPDTLNNICNHTDKKQVIQKSRHGFKYNIESYNITNTRYIGTQKHHVQLQIVLQKSQRRFEHRNDQESALDSLEIDQ